MGDIIEFFDDAKMRYEAVQTQEIDSVNISDWELKKIELELIRFADDLAIAN